MVQHGLPVENGLLQHTHFFEVTGTLRRLGSLKTQHRYRKARNLYVRTMLLLRAFEDHVADESPTS